MKRILCLQMLVLFAASVGQAQTDWQFHRLPGGSALEIVLVNEDDPHVKGMWLAEKQGGMYWVQWNDQAEPPRWEPMTQTNEYDAYYPWFMGGDYCNVQGALYAIAATYQATHRYSWDGNSWEPYPDPATSKAPNGYYRWHDAAFCADEAGVYHPDNFIVSAAQAWPMLPRSYRKGLYLVTNGLSPTPETAPIGGFGGPTDGHNYNYIYRDMDQGRYLYAWYNDEDFGAGTQDSDFQKVTVTGLGHILSASVSADFDETMFALQNVNWLYQYRDASQVRHQFLLAKSKNRQTGAVTVDVWHRQHEGGGFSSTGWGKVVENLEQLYRGYLQAPGFSFNAMSLAAYAEGDAYYVYLVVDGLGLSLIKAPPDGAPTVTAFSHAAQDGSYLRKWSDRSLNLNPWWRAQHPTQDQVIIGSAHGDLHIATIGNLATSPTVISYQTLEDMSGLKPDGTTYKYGSYLYGPIQRGSDLYDIHDGTGLFKARTDPWIRYDHLGISSPDIQNHSDFNFGFRSGTLSPFVPDLGWIYVGGAFCKYYWNAQNQATYHSGIWKLNPAHPDQMWFAGTGLAQPNDIVRSMSSGPGWLYYCIPGTPSNPFEPPPDLGEDDDLRILGPFTVWSSNDGNSRQAAVNTGDGQPNGLNEFYHVTYWLNPVQGEDMYALFRTLRPHPALNVTGVVYGLSCPGLDIDWGDEPTAQPPAQNTQIGGGVGYVYYENGTWQDHCIQMLRCDHTGLTGVDWFEGVIDMLVESNSNYELSHLNVDLLAATGAYQIKRMGEDYPRYGGLFKVYNEAGQPDRWAVIEITPDEGDYQLENGQGFSHPAVVGVDSSSIDGLRYYFCVTMGDGITTPDEPLCLLWYQQADNLRHLTNQWTKFPNPGGPPGRVPYPDPHQGEADFVFWSNCVVQHILGGNVNVFLYGPMGKQAEFP